MSLVQKCEIPGYPRLYLDVDGVLTDGKLNIDSSGRKAFKSFHCRDVRAIRQLVYGGWEVTLVTCDDWPGIEHFANKVGAEVMYHRQKDDLPQPYVAVGDDAWDVAMLERAATAFAPINADVCVHKLSNVRILNTKGGEGVVAEILNRLEL